MSKSHIAENIIPESDASFEDVEECVRNFFYQAGLYWERLENRGLIAGNGHHMAQELAEQQAKELKERWTKQDKQ